MLKSWYPQMTLVEFDEMRVHAMSDNMCAGVIRSINQLDKIEAFIEREKENIDAHRYYGLTMRMRSADTGADFARKGDIVGLFSFFSEEVLEDFEDLFDLYEDIAEPDEVIPGGKNSLMPLSRDDAQKWLEQSEDDTTLMERYLWALRLLHGRNMSDDITFYVRNGWWRIEMYGEQQGPYRRGDLVKIIEELEAEVKSK